MFKEVQVGTGEDVSAVELGAAVVAASAFGVGAPVTLPVVGRNEGSGVRENVVGSDEGEAVGASTDTADGEGVASADVTGGVGEGVTGTEVVPLQPAPGTINSVPSVISP